MGLLKSLHLSGRSRDDIRPRPSPSSFSVVHGYEPPLASECSKFPFALGDVAYDRGLTHNGVFVPVAGEDIEKIRNLVAIANSHIESARSLVDIPAFSLECPDESVTYEESPFWGNYCYIRPMGKTDSGRNPKFPFVIEVNRRHGELSVTSRFSLFSDGSVGRIETEACFSEDGSFGTWYTVTSSIRDGRLRVSRIGASLPDGSMPTLWTLGR